MERTSKRKLEKAGWRVGSAADFLGLAPEEVAFVESKLALVHGLRAMRARAGLTQVELAARIGTSQSRVAKIEAGDESVSMDLLLRSLFALGASRSKVAKLIAAAA